MPVQMIQWQSLDESLHQAMGDAENRQLARSLLATDRPEQISSLLQSFCQAQLGGPIAQCGLCYLSVGATFVVALADDRQLVIKAYGNDRNIATLQAAAQVQMALTRNGFPCPAIVIHPQVWQSTLLVVQTFVDPGDRIDGFASSVRTAMAHRLADLMQHTQRYSQFATNLPLWMPWLKDRSVLWPTPHNVLFDFERTAAAAEWIDQIARTAQQVLWSASGEWAIGHSDWSVQNMAFQAGKLVCVYDWDSLRLGQEAFFVGGAARCFAHDWRFDGPTRSITLEEAISFVQEYEAARGQPFTPEQKRLVGAAIVYTAAYGTRCAHRGDAPETEHSQRAKQQLKEFAAYFLYASSP